MTFNTLISTTELAQHLDQDDWAIVDCRFTLAEPERGRRDYLAGHIPGAVYAHLEEDLSGPIIPGQTGRHPLPSTDQISRAFSHWGIGPNTQVVAYDDTGGSIAGRLWWMLRWLGHPAVAVLDGGWLQWQKEGRPTRSGKEQRPLRPFTPQPRPELLVSVAEVLAHLHDPQTPIVDSRAPERYRGEQEPIDPIAGRVPGARNAPHSEVVGPDGKFLPPETLRRHFTNVLGEANPHSAIFYCGSGVTAARNLLALAHAGLGDARLYAGSWSAWITDPARPIELG